MPSAGSAVRGRGTYFAAGLDLVGRRGAESLTVTALCNRVGATSGSFYHHFTSLDSFTGQLIGAWEALLRGREDRIAALTDPAARYRAAAMYALTGFRHDVEAGMRAWGFSNPVAAAAVARMDRSRELNARGTLELVLDDPARAEVLAPMAIAVITGLQQAKPFDLTRYLQVTQELSARNFGIAVRTATRPNGAVGIWLDLPPARGS